MIVAELVQVLKVLGWTFLGLMLVVNVFFIIPLVVTAIKILKTRSQQKKTDETFLKEMHICPYDELVEK